MNKNAIQKFAIWARNELIAQVSQRAYQYGIDESGFGDASADTLNGRLLTAEEKSQRQELIKQIKGKSYTQVMEEVAYTWFNRFIALRFMEVNNYLPSHIRVFSDSTGAFKPEILSDVLHLDLPGLDREKVTEYIESNDTEGLYRYLLLTQCNALNDPLPRMFEKMGGYTELLLPNNILKQDSVLGHMVADIPEEDWTDQVQIIGWLYQFYNTELKAEVFAKKGKITKNEIPAATQLFTPDWIVCYMVENSLGRIYVDKRKNEGIYADGRGADEMTWEESEAKRIANEKYIAEQMGWKYYLPEAEQTEEVRQQLDEIQREYANLDVKDTKVIDPCMGSGHILVYAFDVLMQIYTSAGWDQREAAQSILKNNLFGLDIDDRATQLAYFAVMMKARQYDRRLLTRGIQPNIYSIRESNGIQTMTIEYFHKNDPKLKADIESIVTEMRDAKEYGSILNITPVDFTGLYARFDEIRNDINMMQMSALEELLPLVKCAELLAQKYDVVVTNPPYMAVSNAGAKVNDYVKRYFPDSKADLFAVFIERCGQMAKKNGYQAMITQHAWMFLSSFEKLRTKLLAVDIVNMAHLGARAFEEIGGEVVQTTSFVIRKSHIADYTGEYCRLIEPTSQQGKEDMFLDGENRYAAEQSNFSKIPGSPVAYWISRTMSEAFSKKLLRDYGATKQGFATGDNNRFLRYWHEPSSKNTALLLLSPENATKSTYKWFPCNKGGTFRKWYGNNVYVANWEKNGIAMRSFTGAVIRNPQFYFKEGISWSSLANQLSLRYSPCGFLFESKGSMCYANSNINLKYLLGLLNSKTTSEALSVLSPTLDFHEGPMSKVPVIMDDLQKNMVDDIVFTCVDTSRRDWDSYETSWDFKRNPLV